MSVTKKFHPCLTFTLSSKLSFHLAIEPAEILPSSAEVNKDLSYANIAYKSWRPNNDGLKVWIHVLSEY